MAVVERRHAGDRKVIRVAPSRGHRSQSWDLLFHGSMPTNAYFFRRRVFQENGSFNTNFAICADRELLIRYKLAGVPTLPVRRVLYRYLRSEEHTSELPSLMSPSYTVFCLKKQKSKQRHTPFHVSMNEEIYHKHLCISCKLL